MLGDRHLRALTVLGFPGLSRPGLLDALNHLDLDYRWVTRFIALDKTEATTALTRLRRQWFNKRKSVSALLREILYNQPAPLLDSHADNQVADSDVALQALGSDEVAFGYLTTTITVSDEDAERADEKIRSLERAVNSLGFTTIRETINAVEAWLSSLPGHVYANVRQPLIHTLNLAHLMPLSCVWAGPERDEHLGGPALITTETSGSTPFRLSAHVGDVGHMLVMGPTGAGKSVLLALIALQFRRYPNSQLYIFDKGFSARAAVLAMGGAHHALGLGAVAGETLAFQPLRRIDEPAERSWAAEWIAALLAHDRVTVTPEVKDTVWSALASLASAPPEERTLTGLALLLQSSALRTALTAYTLDGPYGRLLDAAEQHLRLSDIQCFETEGLLGQTGVVAPVLTYLFHRLEKRFTGKPTLLILDEAWIFLDHPLFAARIREWLKTLRKKNVAVLFATQSLADVADSAIAPAIIESCPQRIFLPNDRAIEPQSRAAYERFGLNERQVELIGRATPKRHYYLQSARGNRLFELGLGPVALALCGASDPGSQARIDALLAEAEGDFAARFLAAAGLPWAADCLATFASTLRPRSSPMLTSLRRHLTALALGLAATGAVITAVALPAAPAHAQFTVFDPTNYTQNLLTAARSLQQINNQIQSLQNQATMLLNQAKNLARVDFPELQQLNQQLQQIDRLMGEAQTIDFRVSGLDQQFKQLFPQSLTRALPAAQQVQAARSRLDAAMDAYRQTMRMQAQVAENVQSDAGLLQTLAGRSQDAEGALQAAQTTNQLLALSAKQQLQIQNLIAAQYRAQATEAARRAQAEIDGRLLTRKFLGSGAAYPSR
jgi:type IV secretion system protein VirB4